MIEILGLIGAIYLVVKVLQLRALLALPFPRYRMRWLTEPPSDGLEDLWAEFAAQSAALGFSPVRWMHAERVDGEAETMDLRGVLRAPDGHGLLWIAAPVTAAHPHRLAIYFLHRFSDGRSAVSQPFDPYFALLQGGDLIARTAGEADLASQWQAHLAWVQSLGAPPLTIADADLPADTEAWFERTRQRLIEQGELRALHADLAVPRIPLALRALGAMRRVPKAPVDPRPVPPARLLRLALNQETVSHRAPPRAAQWSLFGVSVALFMALGALFWNIQLALAILLVVVIHELGHFLAMRAFGYRNVHLLALPLVGGVAMGHDVNPGASKRAWMSLMGPLPGIVIGWALLILYALAGGLPDALFTLALVFLFVNYLNVLPVPPLDGAHVVEALLPPHWARVQTVLLGTAALLGALLAWQFEFYLLTMLALLQLPALPGNWRLHGIERELAAESLPNDMPRAQRLLHVLQLLELRLGPATQAAARIGQALQVLHRIDVKPMGALARTSTGLVYLSLLAVPVIGLLGYGSWAGNDTAIEARIEQQRVEQEAWQSRASDLPWRDLVTAIAKDDGETSPPAGADAIAAAELRLGATLPEDLLALYQTANGLDSAGLLPLDAIGPHPPDVSELWAYTEDKLHLEVSPGDWVELDAAEIADWWYLGGDADAPLFYLPAAHPKLPGTRVVNYFLESPSVYPDLRRYLEQHWIGTQQSRQWARQQREAQMRNTAALADATLEDLLEAWPEPHFLARWMMPALGAGEGADEAELAAAEARLGLSLPHELREMLGIHDGFPDLQLLPARQLVRWSVHARHIDDDYRDQLEQPPESSPMDHEPEHGVPLVWRGVATIEHCVITAAWIRETETEAKSQAHTRPRLLWCPDGAPAAWVDLWLRRGYPDLRAWILPQAAQVTALSEVD